MYDLNLEQIGYLINIVDDEIFRKSSRTGYEMYIEDMEKLLVDLERMREAKLANIEETRKIAREVYEDMERDGNKLKDLVKINELNPLPGSITIDQ